MTTGETAQHGVGDRPMPGLDEPAPVLLIGASGSGKSTLGRPLLSGVADRVAGRARAVVADDECDQSATGDAVGLLKAIVAARLAQGLTTAMGAGRVGRTDLLTAARMP
ncbi:hypothetical protein ACWCQW_56065 [Streptomyces mirabilis]